MSTAMELQQILRDYEFCGLGQVEVDEEKVDRVLELLDRQGLDALSAPELLNAKGVALARKELHEEAVELFTQVIRAAPGCW